MNTRLGNIAAEPSHFRVGPIPTRKKQELGRKKKRKNPSKIFTSIFTNSFSQLLFLQIKFESEKRKKRKKRVGS